MNNIDKAVSLVVFEIRFVSTLCSDYYQNQNFRHHYKPCYDYKTMLMNHDNDVQRRWRQNHQGLGINRACSGPRRYVEPILPSGVLHPFYPLYCWVSWRCYHLGYLPNCLSALCEILLFWWFIKKCMPTKFLFLSSLLLPSLNTHGGTEYKDFLSTGWIRL